MMDLDKLRRARYRKSGKDSFPKTILDVIEAYYTDRYDLIVEDFSLIETLFSKKEWIDILTKTRKSFENDSTQIKKRDNL